MKQLDYISTRLSENFQTSVTNIRLLQSDEKLIMGFSDLTSSIIKSFRSGGKILVCGNGGFASISQHLVSELMGRFKGYRQPLPAISLNSDTSLITCIANDYGFERIFSRQLEALAQPNDVLIALSTSGKSKDILEILDEASRIGLNSFLITGNNYPNYALKLCSSIISFPFEQTSLIQDATMLFFHCICDEMEKVFENKSNVWEEIVDFAYKKEMNTLLLDRDGVINRQIPNGYVLNPSDIVFNPLFLENCSKISTIFNKIFIVSNQACIGKGITSKEKIDFVSKYIEDVIKEHGGNITATFICPDSQNDSFYRKPNIGMAQLIKDKFPDVDFTHSIMVGDSYSDSLFAHAIGATFFKVKNV